MSLTTNLLIKAIGKPTLFNQLQASTQDHKGTWADSLYGTVSPITDRACVANRDASVFGLDAIDCNGFTALMS